MPSWVIAVEEKLLSQVYLFSDAIEQKSFTSCDPTNLVVIGAFLILMVGDMIDKKLHISDHGSSCRI